MSETCGLVNIGNSCYMNSVLQILARINLTGFALNGKVSEDKQELCIVLAHVLECLKTKSCDPKLLVHLRHSMSKCFHQFNNEQQDQHEYLSELLTVLHDCLSIERKLIVQGKPKSPLEELECQSLENLRIDGSSTTETNLHGTKLTVYDSPIYQRITGQLHRQTECAIDGCRYVSHRFESFRIWELDIHGDSLDSCLKFNTLITKQDTNEQYECEHCKTKSRSYRKTQLWRSPDILIICLKRYQPVSVNGNWVYVKNEHEVTVPLKLNIHPYISVEREKNLNYKLFGVANHVGNLNYGHCFSYVKNNEDWFMFNDQQVKKLSLDEISKPSNCCYLLFYQRESSAKASTVMVSNV